jgi:hypothetical protein
LENVKFALTVWPSYIEWLLNKGTERILLWKLTFNWSRKSPHLMAAYDSLTPLSATCPYFAPNGTSTRIAIAFYRRLNVILSSFICIGQCA